MGEFWEGYKKAIVASDIPEAKVKWYVFWANRFDRFNTGIGPEKHSAEK